LQQKTIVNGIETYWPPHLSFLVWLRAACISKRLVWHDKTTDSPLSQIWWPPPPVRVWRHLWTTPKTRDLIKNIYILKITFISCKFLVSNLIANSTSEIKGLSTVVWSPFYLKYFSCHQANWILAFCVSQKKNVITESCLSSSAQRF